MLAFFAFPCRTILHIAVLISLSGLFAYGQEPDDHDGITVYDTVQSDGYRKCWALLIGIDYKGKQIDELRAADPANLKVIPQLKNAANDAKAIAEVLKKYYRGYDEPNAVTVLTDDEMDSQLPTAERIRNEIDKLCDPKRISENDSVLVFFAGHGYQWQEPAPKGNAVSLLPYDANIADGKPAIDNKIFGLPDEFLGMIQKIPAKHRLVVLDSCYSGEIFNARGDIGFQSRSVTNRNDEVLQYHPTFQAMVSCRATQMANDGLYGNSKFTTALLKGLKFIPARSAKDRRVLANRLLAYILPEFDDSQRPDCRDLIGSQGEFCFFPKEPQRFSEFVLQDKTRLMALIASRQGNWWFEETPWFIPSIRREIVRQHEQSQPRVRSGSISDLIEADQLKKAAEELLASHGEGTDMELNEMRYRHVRWLMAASDASKLEEALKQIESDLKGFPPPKPVTSNAAASNAPAITSFLVGIANAVAGNAPARNIPAGDTAMDGNSKSGSDGASPKCDKLALEPEDWHLLAVVQHYLKKKDDAKRSYQLAINKYGESQKHDRDQLHLSLHMLATLCRADHGEFQLTVLEAPDDAIREFDAASVQLQKLLSTRYLTEDSAAFFRIYTLTREADAYRALGRWTSANDKFFQARNVANERAHNHYLNAHVHRRLAWAQMSQWHIRAAISSFRESNKILDEYFRREDQKREAERSVNAAPKNIASVDSQEHPVSIEQPGSSNTASVAGDSSNADAADERPCLTPPRWTPLPRHFRRSQDHASKIAYLHNHHGIAMAMRFEGDSSGSARYYRWLYGEVEDAFSRFLDLSSDADLKAQFVARLINTQEKLGDSNLFGDPAERDVREAVDDYRRAMSHSHLQRGEPRDRSRAALLYKQALALSLPSPVQDTRIALEMCCRADVIYEAQKEKATELWRAQGVLTTKIVQCIHASSAPASPIDKKSLGCDATCKLRAAIEDFRDVIGAATNRDQLEMCLFASKVLLEHGGERDAYQMQADANLLLSFCRIGLTSYVIGRNQKPNHPNESETEIHVAEHPADDNAVESRGAESQAYLRPYYDAVMRAKLRYSAKQVKDLLEIQHEATRGESYVKSEMETPILAMYILGTQGYLLVDLPQGSSKCVSLSEMYDVNTLRNACYESPGLTLPRDIQQELASWCSHPKNRKVEPFDLRWEDPVRSFFAVQKIPDSTSDFAGSNSTGDSSTLRTTVANPIEGHFPFSMPPCNVSY